METVTAWLKSLQMEKYADLLFEAGVTNMLKVVQLKDDELLMFGVKLPDDRKVILDSIGNINSLNSEKKEEAFQVRDTKDPKLAKSLLAMLEELIPAGSRQRVRVVLERIEKVRNEPLSLAFKRHVRTLPGSELEQKLFLTSDEKTHQELLQEGLGRALRGGVAGRALYFCSSLPAVASSSMLRLRGIVCDVAVGKLSTESQLLEGNAAFDSTLCLDGFAVKSPLQAIPKFSIAFSLHACDLPHSIWVVSQDGSGDHRGLKEAVDGAKEGDTIVLRAGVYSEIVAVDKDLHLLSPQPGAAVLEAQATPLTLLGNVHVAGISLRLTQSSNEATALIACKGSPTLTLCEISGMVVVKGHAQVVLRECKIPGSKGHGILVTDKSTCLVEKCSVSNAENCGIQVEDGSRGVVMNSSVSNCEQNGLYLLEGAKGVVEGCDIFGNLFPGIAVKSADPVIARNRIHHNERSGVVVAGVCDGNVMIEDNNVFANGRDGLLIAQDAECMLQQNAVYDNRGSGIQVMSGGKPDIVRCSVFNNREYGVCFGRGSSGQLSSCQIFGNGKCGVSISSSKPDGSGTITTGPSGSPSSVATSSSADFGGSGSTQVVVEGCDVFSNKGLVGVEVLSGAAPRLLHNKIFRHPQHCVLIQAKAAPVVDGNELFGCKGPAVIIHAEAAAETLVSGNTIYACASEAIVWEASASASIAQVKQSNNIVM